MYIKKLQLLNFQVIESFDADFVGSVYFVTGDNELGKSTLLKAIGALLTGNRDDVLRNGASKGFAKMIVGDDGEEFDVQLTFTEANPRGTLTIKQKSTGMQTNNVSMLQRIFGYQDFDAVEFSRWSETAEGRRKQIAVVKSLLPEPVRNRIDAIDTEVATLKSERTGVNRDVKTFAALCEAAAKNLEPGDMERKPIDVSELMAKQQANAALIEKAKTVRSMLAQRNEQLAAIPARIKEFEEQRDAAIAQAKAIYEAAMKSLDAERKMFEERKANAEEWLKKYEANNPEKADLTEQLEQVRAHNERCQMAAQYAEKKSQYIAAKEKADSMDTRISELADERANLIANAELPIEGLSFTDDGLELNGVPFVPGKVSDSQILMTATKLVVASNPNTRIFRIARGESLGAKRLAEIIEIARENHFQGFVENVVRGQEELRIEEYTEFEKKQ